MTNGLCARWSRAFLLNLHGLPWRDVPVEYGHWNKVYKRNAFGPGARVASVGVFLRRLSMIHQIWSEFLLTEPISKQH